MARAERCVASVWAHVEHFDVGFWVGCAGQEPLNGKRVGSQSVSGGIFESVETDCRRTQKLSLTADAHVAGQVALRQSVEFHGSGVVFVVRRLVLVVTVVAAAHHSVLGHRCRNRRLRVVGQRLQPFVVMQHRRQHRRFLVQ